MKRKLLIAALAMIGGCDHQLGIGALEPDAGVALSGQDADASLLANDAGAGVGLQGLTTWTGYIDGYQFPSGSNAIRLALSVDANGRVTGMVVFGDGPPPPPVSDPNVGYPPDYLSWPSIDQYYAEGFAYSFSAISSPWVLHFAIDKNQLWSDWCARQTPVDASGTCLPNWQGAHDIGTNGAPDRCYQRNPATGKDVIIDCGRYDLCLAPVCTCSTTTCVYVDYGGSLFYLAIPGDTAYGNVYQLFQDSANVYFTRDP